MQGLFKTFQSQVLFFISLLVWKFLYQRNLKMINTDCGEMAKNNSLGLILWDSENVCRTKRMVFSVAEASESLQNFIMLLVLYLNAELCAQPLPLWGDFPLETCRPLGITEVVCYCRAVVCIKVDDLCLYIQTAAISVSVLPKPVFSEGGKTVWLLTIFKQRCICCQLGDCAGVQGIVMCQLFPGGHPML